MASRVASSAATSLLTKAQQQSPELAAAVATTATSSPFEQHQQRRPYSSATRTAQQATATPAAASAASSRTTGRPQIPNRFTQAFAQMKEVCPNHISSYASCVMARNNADTGSSSSAYGGTPSTTLSKDSCAPEFRKVKECFRQVRGL